MISISSKARGNPSVTLAAFGKHPAWDDHVDHLGDQSPVIDAFRVAFYDQAIGGNIDTGAWDEKTTPAANLRPFGHVLLTGAGTEWIIARLWPSKDGRGRTRYPLVAAIHAQGVGPDWALTVALPALEALEPDLASAASQEQARSAVIACRARLADQLRQSVDPRSDQLVGPHAAARLADRPELAAPGPSGEPRLGWRRTLQQMILELAPFRPGAGSSGPQLPQHLRVPLPSDVTPERALAEVWSLVAGVVNPGTPIGVIRPLGEGWVDATVGLVTPSTLACLRLGTGKLALASHVPYELDDQAIEALSRAVLGGGPGPERGPAAGGGAGAAPVPRARGGERGWLWIALGLVGLIGVAVLVLVLVQ